MFYFLFGIAFGFVYFFLVRAKNLKHKGRSKYSFKNTTFVRPRANKSYLDKKQDYASQKYKL